MTTDAPRPRFVPTLDNRDSADRIACNGINHRDTAQIGRCLTCGKTIAKG